MPKIQITNKLERYLTEHKRFKVLYGGRGSMKSTGAADILLTKAWVKETKTCCFRELQNSISDSCKALLEEEIRKREFTGFTIQDSTIFHKNGSEFRFKGLSRNPDSVQSMQGFDNFWTEEAQSVSQESLKKQTPTLRKDNSEHWYTFNPQSSQDPISKRFLKPFENDLLKNGFYEDDLHLITRLNYMDNPFFPESLDKERLWDHENESRAYYNHVWLGDYNDTVERAIITLEMFEAAVDAHIKLGFKPRGLKILTHDPADSGDARAYVIRHGSIILDANETYDLDVNDACDEALDVAITNNCDVFRWDCDGLGISLKRQVNDSLNGKKIIADMFKGSESPYEPGSIYCYDSSIPIDKQKRNEDIFRNKRAQCYWRLRERFVNTYNAVVKGQYIDPEEMISISRSIKCIDKLKSEVCRIPKKPSGNGFIQIATKQEMISMGISSPNISDCLMMSCGDVKTKTAQQPIRYSKKVSIA